MNIIVIIKNGPYYVYAHINKINGKIYIGMSRRENPNERWKNGRGYSYNWHFNQAIKKYGWDAFEHQIVAANLTEDEASNMEKFLIEKLQTTKREYGYNFAEGGYNNRGLVGELNPFWHKRPDAAINASAKLRRGTHLSEETKEKIRQGNIRAGKNENSLKALAAHRHDKRPSITGAGNHKSIAVICVETNVTYGSQLEAEREMNLPRSSVWNSIKYGTATKGYHFKRV